MEKRHVSLFGKLVFLALIFCLWGLALIVLPQNAFAQQKPIIIKYAHQLPEAQPIAKQARVFEKCVKERSKGKVIIEVYPAAQLFGARDLFPAVRKGAVEMAAVDSPHIQGGIPSMELVDLPFLFRTWDQVKSCWYGFPGEIWRRDFEKNGIKVMTAGYYGFIEISNSKREIRVPADFKGLKIRTSGPMNAEVMQALGASPAALPGDEAYLAMARKVVDGSITGLVSMASRKYWEVQKYVTLAHLGYIDIPLLINLQFWNGLPKEVKNLLQECAKESEEFLWKETIREEERAVEILKEKGIIVYTPTPVEMEEYRKLAAPVREAWIKKHGDEAAKMVQFVESIK